MNDLITQVDAGIGYVGDVLPEMSTLRQPEEWFFEAITWGRSDSGETVNPKTALTHGPVWQAVNILAGDVGQLPLHVYRMRGRNRERFRNHPVDLLLREPNSYQTSSVWLETMVSWALLWGNGCSAIVRNGAGQPESLIPLLPDRTRPLAIGGEWWIETDFGDGKRVPIPYDDVFHLRGLATDGFWGVSAVQVAKNVIGHGLALQSHGNAVFKNGARPSGILTSPGAAPNLEVRTEYREQWEKLHRGRDNAGRVMFLYGGTTFAPLSMSNEDAQWLEARSLDREFIASLFNLPPYKLGAMANSAVRANLEQQNRDYLTTSLSRWLGRIREECERKFLPLQARMAGSIYLKWIVEAFLRGDLAARGAYYSQAKTGEWMTTNEIRELEDLNPIEGGDELRNPAINPATKKEPEKSPATPGDGGAAARENAQRAARELVHAQASALLETEACTVENTVSAARNAVRWAENYYERYLTNAGNFLRIPCEIAVTNGLAAKNWETVVCDHARDSLNRLLAMAGIATRETLPEIAAEFAESVRQRKDSFAKALIGE